LVTASVKTPLPTVALQMAAPQTVAPQKAVPQTTPRLKAAPRTAPTLQACQLALSWPLVKLTHSLVARLRAEVDSVQDLECARMGRRRSGADSLPATPVVRHRPPAERLRLADPIL
jgi:hypothetical protein